MTSPLPAVLGGAPCFPERLPLVRPWVPDVGDQLVEVLRSGQLTNGRHVRELEDLVAERCAVRNAVAVSSCTAGLMLLYRVLGAQGRVVIPSMTFAASPHAVVWAGGRPVWADVRRDTGGVDPASVAAQVDGVVAISGTHVYGAACDVDELQRIADAARIPLVLDAAHALGASVDGRPVGSFGTAEVFSMSPTKVAVAGEGGVVTTDDDALADAIRIGRDYGNPGSYDTQFVGLNARMSELHAVVGAASVRRLDAVVKRRNELVEVFRRATRDLPGLDLVTVAPGRRSTWKDLTILIDAAVFGLSAPVLARALDAEGIDTRRYFDPPCHRQKAYADCPPDQDLPATEGFTSRVLTLPLHTTMADAVVRRVAVCLHGLHQSAAAVSRTLQPARATELP